MKIVTKLKIFGTFATILVIILGATIYWRANQVDLAIEKDRIADSLVKEAFVLNLLSGDYIQTHGERARTQWMSQYQKLNKSINLYTIESPEEQRILDKLRLGQKAILIHFTQLQENIVDERLPAIEEFERRLSGQLSVDVQEIVSLASGLADINSRKLTIVRQATSYIMLIVVLSLSFLFVFSYLLLARSISRSIRELIDGTKILASGNLNFRYQVKSKDEFGQLVSAFNDMASNLQKLDEIKTEFIFLVSHELRTPVGAIKGLMSMINDGDYGDRTKKLERPLYLITASVDRLLRIVNKMLDVSRIQAGKVILNLTDFNIRDLIDESISSVKPLADEKDIKLVVKKSNSFTIYADRDKVREIIINLIENAIKFTEKGSITVFFEQRDDKIITSISDTGIGVANEYQQKLFDKFDEIKLKHAGKTPGIGLGLYISREFARKMGGDLWIEKSTVGKGSTFAFSLPLSERKIN
ncbi:MAG TPA: HAMP domain-containing sensor histidine kinase [Candidatus Limnocylindrales bacterium]|nr:HAMP domain-containing sensor histidine kinase [Candidatus Limnocylindrales bacterium]